MNTGGGYNFLLWSRQNDGRFAQLWLAGWLLRRRPRWLLVMADNKTLYIAGDTALFSDMALIGRAGIDLAIIPVGDNFTMGPEDSVLALDYLKPKAVIPCHYNTWPPIAD